MSRDPSQYETKAARAPFASAASPLCVLGPVPAHARGYLSAQDLDRWNHLYEETIRAGRFLYAVTFFVTSGIKL
ncbi:MAG: hypothetical protein ACREQR_11200 [Candidatus Binataceae bacterium]